MLNTQKQIIGYCEKLTGVANQQELPESFIQNVSALQNEARERELVVPVVGAFSAGKSTLLNNVIGERVLPEAVSPETSLATELRYCPQQFVEAVAKDGVVTRYEITDMEKLKNDAPRFLYARAFLNCPGLKEIEPLVLVDMPGFDSPLDSHNKAILAYLARGCYYIVLSSGAEEKTPSASLVRRLREIRELERDFTFFVSKTNMVPTQQEIDALLEHYQSVLEQNLDMDVTVKPLGNESGGGIVKILKGIDTETLFFSMYKKRVRVFALELINLLTLRSKALEKDTEENEDLIQEMENGIRKIEQKADKMSTEMRERYGKVSVNDIVNNVGGALDGAADELVSIMVKGKQDAAENLLNELVRTSLTRNIKRKMGDIVQDITVDLSGELSSLSTALAAYEPEINYIESFAQKAEAIMTDLQGEDDSGNGGSLLSGTTGMAYKGISTVLSFISGGVITILEAVIIFLPELLGLVIGFITKKKQESEVLTKLQTEIFPSIKSKIRSELPSFLENAISGIITQAKNEYTLQIEQQRAEVNLSIEAAKTGSAKTAEQRAAIDAALAEVKAIAQETA